MNIQEEVDLAFEKLVELVVEQDNAVGKLLEFGYSMSCGKTHVDLMKCHCKLRIQLSQLYELLEKVIVEEFQNNAH